MLSRFATIKNLVLLLTLACAVAPAVLAEEPDDWIKALKAPVKEKPQLLSAGQEDSDPDEVSLTGTEGSFGTLNTYSPASMRMHAAEHLKKGNFDSAIKLLEVSIDKTPEDMDARQIYADALEQKYHSTTEGNPHTFNKCVKQWYFLYKSSEYPEIISTAAKHLMSLTGKSPYIWPTPKMYLSRVLQPEDGMDLNHNVIASPEPQQVH